MPRPSFLGPLSLLGVCLGQSCLLLAGGLGRGSSFLKEYFKDVLFKVLCMWVFYLQVCMYACMYYVHALLACMYTMCMLGNKEDQKRAYDPLELELQTIVSHHMGTGT